jgi:hypothetical protein
MQGHDDVARVLEEATKVTPNEAIGARHRNAHSGLSIRRFAMSFE